MFKNMKLNHKIIYIFFIIIIFFVAIVSFVLYALSSNMKEVKQVIQYKELIDRQSAIQQLQLNMDTVFWTGFILTLLFVVLFGTIAWIISRGFKKKTTQLSAAVKLLNQGNFDIRLHSPDKSELGMFIQNLQDFTMNLDQVIHDIIDAMEKMEHGNLTPRLQANYHGEFNKIKTAIERTCQSIDQTMHQIYDASEEIAHGSDQLAIGAQDLSQGVIMQGNSIEELSASVQNVAERVESNANRANQASRIAIETRFEVEKGNQQMQEMLVAMKDIRESANEIHKIIKTIDGIAFQTNILALNAAVEAARAGESGKGFAVVADEVRNLAGKSAEAASHTTELIERSMQSVENGTKIADETSVSLSYVVGAVKEASVAVEEIAKASVAQAQAISQIREGVNQISTVIQVNSSTAEGSAAASEELSGQAQMLKSLVSHFKVSKRNTSFDEKMNQWYMDIDNLALTESDVLDNERVIGLNQSIKDDLISVNEEDTFIDKEEIVRYSTEESSIDLDFGTFNNDKY